jgi:hypothetical protein
MNVTPNLLPFNSRPRGRSVIHTSGCEHALFALQPTPKNVIFHRFHSPSWTCELKDTIDIILEKCILVT